MKVIRVTTPGEAKPLQAAEEEARLLEAARRELSEKAEVGGTLVLQMKEQPLVPANLQDPFGTSRDVHPEALALPAEKTRRHPSGLCWKIELQGLPPEGSRLRVDVLGDVIIGRGGTVTDAPDLDLEPYGTDGRSVSRRHVMLRPTRNSLHLIDLRSTNGTYFNGILLGPGTARPITDECTIMLGSFSFQIKVIEAPKR